MKAAFGNFTLFVGSLLLALLVAEAFFSISADRLHNRLFDRYENIDLCTEPHDDPRLIYTIKPGRCGANSLGFIDD